MPCSKYFPIRSSNYFLSILKIKNLKYRKEKNNAFNKSFRENKYNANKNNQNFNLNNISNDNPENTSQLNDPVYFNTSLKKNPNKTQINENHSFIKNTSM